MRITFTAKGWQDYQSWLDRPRTVQRINRMIDEAARTPGVGIGEPEQLRANLAGFWSRRIDQEHRLVHSVGGDVVTVVQCRFHY